MHTFINTKEDNTKIQLEITNDITWVELTEFYFNYIQACGFVLTREQFAEEVHSLFGEN